MVISIPQNFLKDAKGNNIRHRNWVIRTKFTSPTHKKNKSQSSVADRSTVAVNRGATCGIQRAMLQGEQGKEAGHRGIDLARAQGEAAAATG